MKYGLLLLLSLSMWIVQVSAQDSGQDSAFSEVHKIYVFPEISDKAEISILSCTPGSEVYSYFGHTAIRIKDPMQGIDLVYNYGTFNFNTENFYWKFVRRELDYTLSRELYRSFENEYRSDHRKVTEQTLNLNYEQKQAVVTALEENYKEENRYYRYDFFFDNCATRIRDIINTGLGNKIIWDYSGLQPDQTFRELIDPYIRHDHWTDFGIDLGLGMPTDKKAEAFQYMLLPDYLMNIFGKSKIEGQDKPLVEKEKVIFDTSDGLVRPVAGLLSTPGFIMWTVAGIALLISILSLMKKRIFGIFDFFLFLILGLLGILVFFLWFFTKHGVTENNLNILWAFPLHFFIAFFFIARKKPGWFKWYFLFFGSIAIVLIICFTFLPQSFHASALPMVSAVAIRSLTIFRVERMKSGRK